MERLIKVGKVTPKHSSEIKKSKIGIGFEKLDRNVFDPEKAYDKIAKTGVKWIRIQSGWARCEKEKGIYDFSWLDLIVNNLVKRGLKPWMNLSYGNGIYDENAAKIFGCVGCPPVHNKEQKEAWVSFIKALSNHFKGRISYYEVWNEPDAILTWKHGVSGTEYGEFTKDTAIAIKDVDNNAKVIGGVVCIRSMQFLNEAFETGMGKYIDAISFHEYTSSEIEVFERVKSLKAIAHLYNPNIEIIQGESGSQSKSNGHGALFEGAWTEKKQAKQLARHTMADLLSDVKFTSYFSSVDMIEALDGVVNNKSSYLDYGYFGILGCVFDENGFSTGDYSPKPSYYSLQTISSLFSGNIEICNLPIVFLPEKSLRIYDYDCKYTDLINGSFKLDNGNLAFVYWYPSNIMTTDFEGTVTFQTAGIDINPKLIDLISGDIYEIPDDLKVYDKFNTVTYKHLPVKDYPLALIFEKN